MTIRAKALAWFAWISSLRRAIWDRSAAMSKDAAGAGPAPTDDAVKILIDSPSVILVVNSGSCGEAEFEACQVAGSSSVQWRAGPVGLQPE
jgi:hypothetical protein